MNQPAAALIGLLVFFVLVGILVGEVLHRTGLSRWWVLLFFIPIIGVVGFWIFAILTLPL